MRNLQDDDLKLSYSNQVVISEEIKKFLSKEIKTQEKEIERFREIIRKDSTLISILNTDTLNANLEKILREEYLLSKPNEIIYKIEK